MPAQQLRHAHELGYSCDQHRVAGRCCPARTEPGAARLSDDPGVGLVITRDAEEFEQRAGKFLQEGIERNVLATVFGTVRRRGGYGTEPPMYSYHLDAGGALTAVALRTPPWPLLAHGFADPDLAAELIHRWTEQDPSVPGVSGEPATARAISAAWSKQTGGFAQREFVEAIHVLTEVNQPVRQASGHLRAATREDRPMLLAWERDFMLETGLGDGTNASRGVDRRLEHGLQMLWEDGIPVSGVGFHAAVAGTARIGPVYTPPEYRGHGYATAATAATSQILLDRGARQCMLFTDLANPISNHIYAGIGYVRCGDWEQHGFHAPNLPN
jgi:predicted GNAT family acetyltransferase